MQLANPARLGVGFPCMLKPSWLPWLSSVAAKALAVLETQPGDPFESKPAAGTLARVIGSIQK